MLRSYQLAIALALFLACFNPDEVSSFVNHRRPNATYAVPAQNYHPGYNQSRPAVVHQPNIGFHNNYAPNQPQPNIGFGYNPKPVYNGNGYRPANLTGIQGGYRPHNSTSIFHRLFKFW